VVPVKADILANHIDLLNILLFFLALDNVSTINAATWPSQAKLPKILRSQTFKESVCLTLKIQRLQILKYLHS
jgi:hypothetical protein